MFQEIKLREAFKSYHCKSEYDAENVIDRLSRINIFVGSNNSGKSRLLRNLFVNNDYSYLHFNNSKEEFNKASRKFLNVIEDNLNGGGYYYKRDIENISDTVRKILPTLIYFNVNENDPKKVQNACSAEIGRIKDKVSITHGRQLGPLDNIKTWFDNNPDLSQYRDKLIADFNENVISFHRHYIPTLRSLKGLSPKGEVGINSFADIYREKTVQEYFNSHKNKDTLNIFTGLKLYEDVTRLLLGNTKDRNKVKEFEKFLEGAFFEKEVNIVPHLDSQTLHVQIGNKEHAIHNLGDGIQSIIILTYQLFMNQGKNVVFFFEEPETHLHPGYQRLFLETLLDKRFASYQYFITTHSNHFLDITLDYDKISVYSLRRRNDEDEFDVENVTSVDENVLKLIGARTSSVFLSNCTIWVEGITDRIYLRKYLEIIQNSKDVKFKEDYHYSFVEYAGNNITHWSFLDSEDAKHPNMNVERLCSKLLLITDNDGAGLTLNGKQDIRKRKKYERHQKLEKKLGDRYCLLQCREIENLLEKATIEKVVRDFERKNEGLDFTKFHAREHRDVHLGKFIEERVVGIKKKYTYKSDAINDKLQFAKTAVEHINTYEDLSLEARKIAEKIYDFIKDNNK